MNSMNIMPVMGNSNCKRQSTPAFKAELYSNIPLLSAKGIKEAFAAATVGEEGLFNISGSYRGDTHPIDRISKYYRGILVEGPQQLSTEKLMEWALKLQDILKNKYPDKPVISEIMDRAMVAILEPKNENDAFLDRLFECPKA